MAKGAGAGLGSVAAKQSENAAPKLTTDETKAFGLGSVVGSRTAPDGSIYVVLKYYDSDHECFSSWNRDELSQFSQFLKKLGDQTWNTISSGMRPKPCDPKFAKNGAKQRLELVQTKLSKDIQFVELRVSKRARVHGFRLKDAFFLVLLDRDHQTFPE